MQKSNQPAAEWKPPSAISGDTQVPTDIKAAIRMLFASQIKPIPMGSKISAFGKRSDFRNTKR